jgi:transposase
MQVAALPKDFPPWRNCYGFMARWAACGVVGQIRDQLRIRVRREMGKAPGAVATVIDSQSIKAADTVGKDSRGYDAGKKINGRKRHLVVDTKGLPLFVMVTPADMTDRNAAKEVLFRLRLMHPKITIVWADSAYAGQLVTWAKTYLNLTIKTVSRPKDASGFVVLPRRSSNAHTPGSCTPADMHATTNGSSSTRNRSSPGPRSPS